MDQQKVDLVAGGAPPEEEEEEHAFSSCLVISQEWMGIQFGAIN